MEKGSASTTFRRLFLILLLFCIAVSVIRKEHEIKLVAGMPAEYVQEQISITKSIDQIVEDCNYIYVLFDSSKDGIVQVYSQEGYYQKSIQCYSHMNGRFQIAVHDQNFYLRDKEGSLYRYYDGTFIEFIDSRQAASLRKRIDFETSSPNYALRFGSVWRINDDESRCIIERPLGSALSQSNVLLVSSLLIIAFGGYLSFKRSSKK